MLRTISQCVWRKQYFSYLDGAFVRLLGVVCPHVCVELSGGWILLTTGWALVSEAKKKEYCTIIFFVAS